MHSILHSKIGTKTLREEVVVLLVRVIVIKIQLLLVVMITLIVISLEIVIFHIGSPLVVAVEVVAEVVVVVKMRLKQLI